MNVAARPVLTWRFGGTAPFQRGGKRQMQDRKRKERQQRRFLVPESRSELVGYVGGERYTGIFHSSEL